MPGAAKPVNLLRMEGKGHRTKAEMDYRERGEKAMKTGREFKVSPLVKKDKIAHSEFLRLKRLFSKMETELVDALDQQIINRYCLEVSNTYTLQEMLLQLSSDLENAESMEDRMELYSQIRSTNTAMTKNKELLLKYEDRLFLNPASRIKAIPKTPPKEEKLGGIAGFMAKRAEM